MKPKISATVERIALIALGLAEGFVNQIKDEYAKSVLKSLFGNGKALIKALADADPNDKQQIQGIVDAFVSEVLPKSEQELLEKIQAVENETVRTILLLMIPVASGVVRDLTDGVKPNSEQLENRLKLFVTDGDAMPVIDALLSLFIDNAGVRALIVISIIEAIKTFIEGTDDESSNLNVMRGNFEENLLSISV